MNRKRDSRKALALCTVLLMVFLLGDSGTPGADDRIVPASLSETGSQAAPDFELPDLNGNTVRLGKYKGDRPVLIYFWATWCPYCIAAKPQIAKIREQIVPERMEILAIDVGGGDSLEKVKRYQEGHPVSWPVLFDGMGVVSRSYKVQGIPLFVVVDREGNVTYRGNTLPDNIEKLLR